MTGPLSPATRILEAGAFPLECGEVLPEVRVAYRTWGRLDPRRPRASLVCHALTGSADADLWWPELLGPGRALDPERELVVCSNVLGGCYGTTGPTGADPRTGRRWGGGFPPVSVRDMVRLQAVLLDRLGVEGLSLVVGGSLGGMQALEWAASFPERVEAVAAIAVGASHSPWCIALSEAQRQAIYADPAWRGGHYPPERPPERGLAVARMTAMCSYRSPASFALRFGREERPAGGFQVEGYLHHHGRKLVRRFDAASYVTLTRAMDGHDLGRGRGGVERALAGIRRPVLVVAIDSDVLYPPREQEDLARALPGAELARLPSPHGHDAFLIEGRAVDGLVRAFRERSPRSIPSAAQEARRRCAS